MYKYQVMEILIFGYVHSLKHPIHAIISSSLCVQMNIHIMLWDYSQPYEITLQQIHLLLAYILLSQEWLHLSHSELLFLPLWKCVSCILYDIHYVGYWIMQTFMEHWHYIHFMIITLSSFSFLPIPFKVLKICHLFVSIVSENILCPSFL